MARNRDPQKGEPERFAARRRPYFSSSAIDGYRAANGDGFRLVTGRAKMPSLRDFHA
jgi:hypothetical protein